MDDLISRWSAIDAFERFIHELGIQDEPYNYGEMALCKANVPSVQPERKAGKWERHYSRPGVYADLCWHCSLCGYKSADNWANKFKYCPDCGADMRGGENETD